MWSVYMMSGGTTEGMELVTLQGTGAEELVTLRGTGAEEQAKREAEEQAKREAEEQAMREAGEQAMREAEEAKRARREVDDCTTVMPDSDGDCGSWWYWHKKGNRHEKRRCRKGWKGSRWRWGNRCSASGKWWKTKHHFEDVEAFPGQPLIEDSFEARRRGGARAKKRPRRTRRGRRADKTRRSRRLRHTSRRKRPARRRRRTRRRR